MAGRPIEPPSVLSGRARRVGPGMPSTECIGRVEPHGPETLDPAAAFGCALPRFPPGEVWLAGAGPGDPGLLTLHAVNALGQADVILYDALVHEAVLRLARPDVMLEFAGKRGGRPRPISATSPNG